jgi:hypothetical protein
MWKYLGTAPGEHVESVPDTTCLPRTKVPAKVVPQTAEERQELLKRIAKTVRRKPSK